VIEASEATVAAVACARLRGLLTVPVRSRFLALSVIPQPQDHDHGLVDVDRFELVPLAADIAVSARQ
jgi:adenine deaminase